VVASIEGRRNQSGYAVAFRADMDALEIREQSGQPWSSQTPGKMHACGHNGHTATLLTLARYLQQTRNFDGLVRLIFQPAEEGGRGAFLMLEEGLLERFPLDEIYGYHNWPGLARGVFAIRPGPMLAAVDEFEIRLNGNGGHAAMPHLTHDVVPAVAQLVLALQTLVSRETDPTASAVVSVTNVSAGSEAFNVISEAARLSGTVRTFCQDIRDHHEARFRAIASGIASAFRVSSECQYTRLMDPVINEPQCTLHCRAAAAAIVGEENVRDIEAMMVGKDFGGFLQRRPGAFILIGQGESRTHLAATIPACIPLNTISTMQLFLSQPVISLNLLNAVCQSTKEFFFYREFPRDRLSTIRIRIQLKARIYGLAASQCIARAIRMLTKRSVMHVSSLRKLVRPLSPANFRTAHSKRLPN
jgi:amidohydrolase